MQVFLHRYQFLACFLFAFCQAPVYGQGNLPLNMSNIQTTGPGQVVVVDKMTGRVGEDKPKEDIGGSPYLVEEWHTGTVTFRNGKFASKVPLRFNVALNQLNFLQKNQSLFFTDTVQECYVLLDVSDSAKYLYLRSGYPPSGELTGLTLYEVLAEGAQVHLLKLRRKNILEIRPYNEPVTRRYTDVEELYVYDRANNSVSLIKKQLQSITAALPAHAANIQRIVSVQKLKLKSDKDLVSLFNFLNDR
jgi:hypothetical protein